ncbi:MAG: hypothetical protein JWM05_1265, partial [Acidimicrobiales bacterium]|nr:hypothetical protein [Acidimicrobiales bacterium]
MVIAAIVAGLVVVAVSGWSHVSNRQGRYIAHLADRMEAKLPAGADRIGTNTNPTFLERTYVVRGRPSAVWPRLTRAFGQQQKNAVCDESYLSLGNVPNPGRGGQI